MHMQRNYVAKERRDSRAQQLHQQQQQKQRGSLYAGRPSLASVAIANLQKVENELNNQLNNILPLELQEENVVPRQMPVLFLTNTHGLHLRTQNSNGNNNNDRFDVIFCDLEGWRSNARNLVPLDTVINDQPSINDSTTDADFYSTEIIHNETNQLNSDEKQFRTCVML